jgi:hypothetical protein
VAIGGEIAGDGNVAAVRTAFALLCKYWESNDQVPRVGTQLESWLRQTGEFGEVNVHKVIAPVGNTSSEPAAAAARFHGAKPRSAGGISKLQMQTTRVDVHELFPEEFLC